MLAQNKSKRASKVHKVKYLLVCLWGRYKGFQLQLQQRPDHHHAAAIVKSSSSSVFVNIFHGFFSSTTQRHGFFVVTTNKTETRRKKSICIEQWTKETAWKKRFPLSITEYSK
jgi:hypothetical protein